MLELKVHDGETEVVLQFEHSLLSLSKWESKHKKAFLSTPMKNSEEMIDYFEMMLLSPGISSTIVYRLSPEQLDQLTEYINESRTASSVPIERSSRNHNPETVTSELLYYQMVALRIPFETQTWHLSRLTMLIAITAFKQQPPKKSKPGEMLNTWREANAARKKEFGTTG